MKDNYKAWAIDVKDFANKQTDKERLEFLIGFAILAPSSHNSQPWKFEVRDSAIDIFVDSRRSLPESDKNNRQLFISIGCALENLTTAADYCGYGTVVKLLPQSNQQDLAAHVDLSKKSQNTPDNNHLIFSILKRCANRNKYSSKSIDATFMSWLKSHNTENIQVDLISDQEKKNQVADVVIEAGIVAMGDKGFRHELSRYVKNNYTSSPVGMPLYGFGVPGPVSLVAPFMMKHINMNKVNAKTDMDILKNHTPAVLIISTRDDTRKEWLEAGVLYERIALEAERRGLSTAPSAAAIQIGEFYKKLQTILGTNYRPQFFARIGYADASPSHSPRLQSREVIK